MSDTVHHIHLYLPDGTGNLDALHIHIDSGDITLLEEIVSGNAEILAKVAEISTGVQTVLATTAEIAKDVARLISEGDTAGAVAALTTVSENVTTAAANLAAVDAAIEAASPEPVVTETTEPVVTPVDELLN